MFQARFALDFKLAQKIFKFAGAPSGIRIYREKAVREKGAD